MDNLQLTFEIPKDEFPRGLPVDSISIQIDFGRPGRTGPTTAGQRAGWRLNLALQPDRGQEYHCLVNGHHRFDLWQADACASGVDGEDLHFVVIPTGNMLDDVEPQPASHALHELQLQASAHVLDQLEPQGV